jgi:hypothetical protein
MSSLNAKDRVSLCSFTFSDGRRCRTPRTRNNPRFCPYHAQEEARARTAQKLGKDLDYFFSGDYLSACDLSTALARLIPAVVRGDVKPKTARTVAYMAQTLLQAIHISEHEYINAFGTDAWREAVRNSVNGNQDYRFPPAPEPEQPGQPQPQPAPPQTPAPKPSETPVICHSVRSEEPAFSPSPAPPLNRPQSAAVHPIPAPQPAPSPHTPLPPTGAEFAQRVLARLQTGAGQPPQPAQAPSSPPPQPAPAADPVVPVAHPLRGEAVSPVLPPKATPSSPSAPTTTSAASPTQPQIQAQQTPASHPTASSPGCHPERSEGSHPIPRNPFAPSAAPTAHPDNPPQTAPSTPQPAPNRDPYAIHFDHNYRLLIDGKPF